MSCACSSPVGGMLFGVSGLLLLFIINGPAADTILGVLLSFGDVRVGEGHTEGGRWCAMHIAVCICTCTQLVFEVFSQVRLGAWRGVDAHGRLNDQQITAAVGLVTAWRRVRVFVM